MDSPSPYDAVMGGKKKSSGKNLRDFLDTLDPYVRQLFKNKRGKISSKHPGVDFKLDTDIRGRYIYITLTEAGRYYLSVHHYYNDAEGNNMQVSWYDDGATEELTITRLHCFTTASIGEAKRVHGATEKVKEYAQPNRYSSEVNAAVSRREAARPNLTHLIEVRGQNGSRYVDRASLSLKKGIDQLKDLFGDL